MPKIKRLETGEKPNTWYAIQADGDILEDGNAILENGLLKSKKFRWAIKGIHQTAMYVWRNPDARPVQNQAAYIVKDEPLFFQQDAEIVNSLLHEVYIAQYTEQTEGHIRKRRQNDLAYAGACILCIIIALVGLVWIPMQDRAAEDFRERQGITRGL